MGEAESMTNMAASGRDVKVSDGESGRVLQGDGEMAELIRAKDWSTTPLGGMERWSETLISTVNLMLLSPFPFALYWGEEHTLLYNDGFRPFLGTKHPAALGSAGETVWPEAWELVGSLVQAAFVDGTIANSTDVSIPVLIAGLLQERYWTYCMYPVFQDGRICGVANICHDSTAAVAGARGLKESELRASRTAEELSQVLAATTDAVVSVDRDWVMTYMNPKATSIYGASEGLIGRNMWEAFPDAVYEGSPFVEHYYRAMDEGIAGSFEAHYPEPLNLWLRLEVYPTRDGVVTFSRDVTEQKQISATLVQTEKLAAVGRLAASIAHEINNPLESVTNLLYLVRHSEDVAEIHEYIDVAERELRRVSLITNQTLRFHKQATNPVEMYCQDLIGESLLVYQGRLVNSNVTVEKRKRAVRPVSCFDGEIRQVLTNLIGNAIDAMPRGGRLLVRSREARHGVTGERGLVLTVADTGSGMSEAVRRRIFDPFYTTKGIGGTGLGLWVTSEIVGRHRGTMRVRSKVGRGTVFTLFLPFDAATRQPS